jgi:hypothetical protein
MKGGWRRLHNEELHNLNSLPSIIRIIKLEDQDVDGWIMLKLILERQDRVVWTGMIWLRIGISGGLL